jgi:hypothetical protein
MVNAVYQFEYGCKQQKLLNGFKIGERLFEDLIMCFVGYICECIYNPSELRPLILL